MTHTTEGMTWGTAATHSLYVGDVIVFGGRNRKGADQSRRAEVVERGRHGLRVRFEDGGNAWGPEGVTASGLASFGGAATRFWAVKVEDGVDRVMREVRELDAEVDAMRAEPEVADVPAELAAEVDAATTPATREAWLMAAVDALRPLFREVGVELPAEVAVSVGWPARTWRKAIGQCWPTATADGVPHMYVSPVLGDAVEVLAVLAHELVHAWDDCKSGHTGPFARTARAIGLTGKMTATVAGDELRETLAGIAETLGAYPHRQVKLSAKGIKKQSTRMLKVECPACGYTLRTTAKWLEVGTPTCPCGSDMEAAV